MTNSFHWEVQKAIYTQLTQNPKFKEIIGNRLYDTFVPMTDFPYVVLGLGSAQPWSSKSFRGEDYSIPIHIWSDYKGQKEVKEIAELIGEALRTDFPPLDHLHIVRIFVEHFHVQVDQENQLMHGILKMRIRAHEL